MRPNNPSWAIIHCSGGVVNDNLADTSHHTFEDVNAWHKKTRPFKSSLGYDIGYHYYIQKYGKIKQGRNDLEEGGHCVGMNDKSVGICLAGNFDRPMDWENSYPTKEQSRSLKKLLRILVDRYKIPLSHIVPHRRFANKTCYGRNLTDTYAQDLFKEKKY